MDVDAGRALRLYGTTRAPVQYRLLKAGLLTARLEEGNLRYVTFAGQEVLRAVSYVIRDCDWGTYQPPIENLAIEEDDRRFRVTYEGACRSETATLRFRAEIVGSADGHLSFVVEATPDGPFETNRCGFNILHPLDVAGQAVAVGHTDGTVEHTVFPALIEPWQPFKDIRALTHRPSDRFEAACRLEGDTFEMEDQRNWSDASFKTYVRPIELPWPYILPAGETNRQSVTLTITGGESVEPRARPSAARGDRHARIEIGTLESYALPPIGVVVTPDEVDAALPHIDHLRELGPQAILCHYDPTVGHGLAAVERFAALQNAYPANYSLECVVAAKGNLSNELEAVADHVRSAGLLLSSVAVCPSVDRQSTPPGSLWPECPSLEEVYRAARAAFPQLPLGGGMFSYFTELNRKRPPVDLIDFITHATNPIVHAADDESVMETLTTLPHITRSVRAFIGSEKAYRIGPSTIGMRQNPYGSRTIPNPGRERICMAAEDPRQEGLFAAAWTIGYAAAAAPGRLDLLVPGAFSGPRGVLDERAQAARPVFHAVRWLARAARKGAVSTSSDDPKVAALASRDDDRVTLFIANLSKEPCHVRLGGVSARAHVTIVDAAAPDGRPAPSDGSNLHLDSFAVARVEL